MAWSGLGSRLKQAMIAAGYVMKDGDADCQRFGMKHGWLPNYLYRWTKEENTPDETNLRRLAAALNVTPWWLMFGDEVSQTPARPRKRARKVLGCLAGALMMTAAGMVPASARTLADGADGQQCFLSARRRRPRRICADRVFPDLIAA